MARCHPPTASRRHGRFEEQHNDACFIVKDATRQALGYFYFEDEPDRRSAAKLAPTATRMLFKSWLSRRPRYIQFL